MDIKELTFKAEERIKKGESLMLVKIEESEGSTPRGKDTYMVVDSEASSMGTIGGGKIEYQATLDASELLKESGSMEKSYSLSREDVSGLGMICGGNVRLAFRCLKANNEDERDESLSVLYHIRDEYLKNQGRVIIFGGGHVSRETVPVLSKLGFLCTVYDDREDFAKREDFPDAERIICDDYEDVVEKTGIGEHDYVIIMTRGHQFDYEIQKQVLLSKAMFIGVIGSRAKLETIDKKLTEDGFSEADLARFYAPLGLQIGAESPEEIAISIAAELILVRADAEGRRKVRQGKTLKLSDIRSPR